MRKPRRLDRQAGRHALVDGIPFQLPVNSAETPALMAAFPIRLDRATELLPGNEVHALRFGRKALLLITVVDYRVTDIGKYVEFSIAIACTHGRRPAPPFLPFLLQGAYGMGQYVLDLPVSSEISVKGGKGIWGMPKHQAQLDFIIDDHVVSSQYDLDGKLVMRIDVKRPSRANIPVAMGTANYCEFRGMLMKSYIHFKGKVGMSLFRKGSATLTLGDHPKADTIRRLEPEANPVFSAFFPSTAGVLDDHFECWFISTETPPARATAGLETVYNLGLSHDWLAPPNRTSGVQAPATGTPSSRHDEAQTARR